MILKLKVSDSKESHDNFIVYDNIEKYWVSVNLKSDKKFRDNKIYDELISIPISKEDDVDELNMHNIRKDTYICLIIQRKGVDKNLIIHTDHSVYICNDRGQTIEKL